ncbi:hypothetical protein C922_05344 [Plasmodium inui San Antonio 1]|uniref:Uncharacterized protein n=1 Tax=Plasmodium inui San Antonio 1 TaxID=1237626 RepID=W6ZY81_9APIC|nr:hypothetical protein C922_05344 [Plasmodium inui San Antonio 1]EUD64278.1 hypothetical protein C922_05344 [Plasmodium inui San Antonio 1]
MNIKNSPRIILKASGIKKEFKGIFYSFGEGEDYHNHDGMYHRKDSDHEGRDDEDDDDEDDDTEDDDDEDEEDEDHEDEDYRDQDQDCYQRRSYYLSGVSANDDRQEFAYYQHGEKSEFYYDGDEFEEIFTKKPKRRVKDNLRKTIREPSDTNSDEERMCTGSWAKRSQGQQHYQNRSMPGVRQREKSSGETGSDFGERSESSNSIDNFSENIDRQVKEPLLHSFLPHARGHSQYSQREKSSCNKLEGATSILRFFTQL